MNLLIQSKANLIIEKPAENYTKLVNETLSTQLWKIARSGFKLQLFTYTHASYFQLIIAKATVVYN